MSIVKFFLTNGQRIGTSKGTPHRKFLDMTICYMTAEDEIIRDNKKMTEEEMYEQAMENLKDGKIRFYPIEEAFKEFLTPNSSNATMPISRHNTASIDRICETQGILILTNVSKTNGASVILDEELLQNLCAGGREFFILPSSIHELLLLRINEDLQYTPDTIEHLRSTVKDVNQQEVSYTEFLSDSVYKLANGKIEIAG